MRFGRRNDADVNRDEFDAAGGVGWLKRATLAVVFIVILAVAGAGWFAYDQGLVQVTDAEIPFIKAEQGETKVRPEDPGGLEIPYQDKLVFERLAPDQSEPLVERLLPPPEIPIERLSLPNIPALAGVAPPASTGSPTVDPAGNLAGNLADNLADNLNVDPVDDPDIEEIVLKPAEPQPEIVDTAQAAEPEPERLIAPEQLPEQLAVPERLVAQTPARNPAETPAPPKRDDQIAQVIERLTAEEPASELVPGSPPETLQASLPASPKPDSPLPKAAPTDRAGWRIQVASLRNSTSAEGEWVRLKQRHADVLAGLSLNLQRADLDSGTFYRIQAGPLPDRGSAERVCDRLKSRSQGCLVVSP